MLASKLPNVLPALKANHPHHSMNNPTTAFVGLPIGGSPSMSHLPKRAPIVFAATKALSEKINILNLIISRSFLAKFVTNIRNIQKLHQLPETPPIR